MTDTRKTRYSDCARCGVKGTLPYPMHYIGLGDSPVAFCLECPRGRQLERDWAARPKQRAYARRIREQKAARAREQSSLGKAFADARLPDLIEQPGARYECARYVRHWKDLSPLGRGLYFFGRVGTGKTLALAVLANELVDAHLAEILTLAVPDLAASLRDAYGDARNSDAATLVRRMKSVELLVLDDLGLEAPSDWVRGLLYRVVDARSRENLPVVVASCLAPGALAKRYSRQLASRIGGMCKAVRLEGRDRRRRRLPG